MAGVKYTHPSPPPMAVGGITVLIDEILFFVLTPPPMAVGGITVLIDEILFFVLKLFPYKIWGSFHSKRKVPVNNL